MHGNWVPSPAGRSGREIGGKGRRGGRAGEAGNGEGRGI